MILYHCTTPKKLKRYKATGCILTPVRGWSNLDVARKWCKQTGRTIILKIEADIAYPLPDHKPLYRAYWTPNHIFNYKILERRKYA